MWFAADVTEWPFLADLICLIRIFHTVRYADVAPMTDTAWDSPGHNNGEPRQEPVRTPYNLARTGTDGRAGEITSQTCLTRVSFHLPARSCLRVRVACRPCSIGTVWGKCRGHPSNMIRMV